MDISKVVTTIVIFLEVDPCSIKAKLFKCFVIQCSPTPKDRDGRDQLSSSNNDSIDLIIPPALLEMTFYHYESDKLVKKMLSLSMTN